MVRVFDRPANQRTHLAIFSFLLLKSTEQRFFHGLAGVPVFPRSRRDVLTRFLQPFLIGGEHEKGPGEELAAPIMETSTRNSFTKASRKRVCRAVGHALGHSVDIIAPACGLSMSTPLENLRALTDMAKNVKNVHTRGCGQQSGSLRAK